MISEKDAKKFLSKDKFYKVSKDDIKSFLTIIKKSPSLIKPRFNPENFYEEYLERKVFYINYKTYNNLYNIYEKNKLIKYYSFVYITFSFFTLEDAIKRSDVLPIIFYYDDEYYEIKKDKIKILLEDFIFSFKTIESYTKKIYNFVKKIRLDLDFKIKNKPDLIPKSKPKSKPDLIPKSKPKSKPNSKPDLIPKSKPKSKPDLISKKINNNFNSKEVKDLVNEINKPLTKNILGIKIPKEKINNLTTEKVIVLTWFIRAFIKI